MSEVLRSADYETSVSSLRDLFDSVIPYLKPAVTDLCVNASGECFIYRRSSRRARRLPFRFTPERTAAIIQTVAGINGTYCAAERPRLEATLPESLFRGRLEGLLPPVVSAPVLVVRFPPRRHPSLQNLVEGGTLSDAEASRLRIAVRAGKNIVIVGATTSGKTTLANALLDELTGERILVVEDTPELVLRNRNTVYLSSGDGFTTAEALKACLRMRPDRIIIGELRDGAAVQNYLNSCVSAHAGLCTLHASAETVVSRIYGLVVQQTGRAPNLELIYRSIDLIVELDQVAAEGSRSRRKVTRIACLDPGEQELPAGSGSLSDEQNKSGKWRKEAWQNVV